MGRRSSKLVALGAAIFVVGAALVFVGLRGGPDGEPTAATTVVESPTPSPGASVVAQGAVADPISTVRVAKGHEAVAVQLQPVPGLAGYAQPGTHINVYATVKSGEGTKRLEPPYAKLVLTNVEILDVSPPEMGDPTFLLSLNPAQAERVIFFAAFESLWFTLVPDGAAPASTRGFDHTEVVRTSP